MNIIDERNQLKNEIDKVNNPDTHSRISTLLASEERSLMTDEQLAIVKERKKEYLRDPSTAIPLEEFDAVAREKDMVFNIVLTQPARKDLLFIMDWYDEQQ